ERWHSVRKRRCADARPLIEKHRSGDNDSVHMIALRLRKCRFDGGGRRNFDRTKRKSERLCRACIGRNTWARLGVEEHGRTREVRDRLLEKRKRFAGRVTPRP